MVQCAGCYQETPHEEFLKCAQCNAYYDLPCTNIPESHFYSTMTAHHKSNWKCQACVCKMPKGNNMNTPLKELIQSSTQIDTNVTLRKKSTANLSLGEYDLHSPNDASQSVDEIIGDTINDYIKSGNGCINIDTNIEGNEHLTLNNISLLLDAKLDKIKLTILEDLKQIIQAEIKNSMKNFHYECGVDHAFQTAHKDYQEEINKVDKKIENIQEKLQNLENTKKIVIYGLTEEYRETETNLYERASTLFYEVMGVNIDPYIEDIKRIGKTGKKRPVAIELISKRMTNYILENVGLFRNTGINIEKYMDRKALEERNELRQNLIKARKNGDYAIIRNNKLFINGKEFTSRHEAITETPPIKSPIKNKVIEDILPSMESENTPTNHSYSQPTPSISSTKVNYKSKTVINKTFL